MAKKLAEVKPAPIAAAAEKKGIDWPRMFEALAFGIGGLTVGYVLRGAGDVARGTAELVRAPGEARALWHGHAPPSDELSAEDEAILAEHADELDDLQDDE